MTDPTENSNIHLLSNRQITRSNRCGKLTKNLCITSTVLLVILSLIFKEAIERIIAESTYLLSNYANCDCNRISTTAVPPHLEDAALLPKIGLKSGLVYTTEPTLGKYLFQPFHFLSFLPVPVSNEYFERWRDRND